MIDFLVNGGQDVNICYLILSLKLKLRYFGTFSKVPIIVPYDSTCTRPLTFENNTYIYTHIFIYTRARPLAQTTP